MFLANTLEAFCAVGFFGGWGGKVGKSCRQQIGGELEIEFVKREQEKPSLVRKKDFFFL